MTLLKKDTTKVEFHLSERNKKIKERLDDMVARQIQGLGVTAAQRSSKP